MAPFKIHSEFEPGGDQPAAIDALVAGVADGKSEQVLLGVTGSGKTFTMAHVIERLQRPALVLAHNKTLAAQLYGEMKAFFPENAVEYFVSYYDYYQPEAYIPKTDTFIEKDSAINEQIDLLRHSATRALLERRDVIVVASVSCIYGLGSPEFYSQIVLKVQRLMKLSMSDLAKQLVELQYERNDVAFTRGCFRIRGDNLDIFPSHYEDRAWRLSFFGDEIDGLHEFDALTGQKIGALDVVTVYANSHYITPRPTLNQTVVHVKEELKERVRFFEQNKQLVEAQRIEQRTMFDMEMIQTTGACKGIENYSRYLSGRKAGEAPPTLFEYLPEDALLFVDESHVMVPQVRGMYRGDRARKETLCGHGFRLPSALDNRPLMFEEWDRIRPQTVYVSATPQDFELDRVHGEVVEQVVRPTGLIDPECIVRPAEFQIDDLLGECQEVVAKGLRVLVTALTKKMAEDIADYMQGVGLKVTYLHSDVKTLERIEIIQDLRKGEVEVLVGVNLLREGLDIPECGLVAILDADKEGFLRSTTSLIQTIGRAARNVEGRVILYADRMTGSLEQAMQETQRRREKQQAYNKEHGITPRSVKKAVSAALDQVQKTAAGIEDVEGLDGKALEQKIAGLRTQMLEAASKLEFEKAALMRDEVRRLEERLLGVAVEKK